MKRLVLLAGLILVLAGCTNRNTPPPPEPTAFPTTMPSPTLLPVTPTATPVEIPVQVTSETANCRFGPGTVYLSLSEIRNGRSLIAVGRDNTATWWQVEDPINPGGFCWISAEVTEEGGDMQQLPVAAAPWLPSPRQICASNRTASPSAVTNSHRQSFLKQPSTQTDPLSSPGNGKPARV
ncbi:MAG: membrane lipoprotein lipid attachment site-containing protein [Anaerolineales bacterium]|uniref:membrane lipoprotein lipid attachment site-containing protein n=1 Tax=Candidatus Villigracilis vicinus TaxID=3140679 RepID=UPI0031361716|nr:membrane lipoprotein lipid attachment site-containing protein [Anaerolineales bacterium]